MFLRLCVLSSCAPPVSFTRSKNVPGVLQMTDVCLSALWITVEMVMVLEFTLSLKRCLFSKIALTNWF